MPTRLRSRSTRAAEAFQSPTLAQASPRTLAALLAPHSTDKETDADLIGEKGVGMTYTVFSSNLYEVSTSAGDGTAEAVIRNAASWKNGTSSDDPEVELTIADQTVVPWTTAIAIEAGGH